MNRYLTLALNSLIVVTPTVLFVILSADGSLKYALLWTVLAAGGAAAVKLSSRESPLAAIAGLLIAATCAIVALNTAAGGPNRWWEIERLRQTYSSATWTCFAVNTANGLLQVRLYEANRVALLGVVHSIVPMIYAVIVSATVFRARRQMRPPVYLT